MMLRVHKDILLEADAGAFGIFSKQSLSANRVLGIKDEFGAMAFYRQIVLLWALVGCMFLAKPLA